MSDERANFDFGLSQTDLKTPSYQQHVALVKELVRLGHYTKYWLKSADAEYQRLIKEGFGLPEAVKPQFDCGEE